MAKEKTVRERHNEAMAYAMKAHVQWQTGDRKQARQLFSDAYDIEADLAEEFKPTLENEPTRSILFLSAASLALCAGYSISPVILAADGLKGFPNDRTRFHLELIKDKKITCENVWDYDPENLSEKGEV